MSPQKRRLHGKKLVFSRLIHERHEYIVCLHRCQKAREGLVITFDAISTVALVRLGAPPTASQTFSHPIHFSCLADFTSSVWCISSKLGMWLRPLRMIKLVAVCALPLSDHAFDPVLLCCFCLARLSSVSSPFLLDLHAHATPPRTTMIQLSASVLWSLINWVVKGLTRRRPLSIPIPVTKRPRHATFLF